MAFLGVGHLDLRDPEHCEYDVQPGTLIIKKQYLIKLTLTVNVNVRLLTIVPTLQYAERQIVNYWTVQFAVDGVA